MSLIKCYIYNKTRSNFVEVKQKVLISLIKACQMRGDNKFNNFSGTVKLHVECRKSCTRKSSICISDLKQASASTASKVVPTTHIKNKVRSSHQSLKLKSKCLFYFEIIPDIFSDIQKKKPVENRHVVCTVTSLNVAAEANYPGMFSMRHMLKNTNITSIK